MKALVYTLNNWSLFNISSVLHCIKYELMKSDKIYNLNDYNILITCNPTAPEWGRIYNRFKNRIPIIGMQQSLSYNPYSNPKAYWPEPNMMIWGSRYINHYRSNNFKGKVFVTGLPKFDHLFNIKRKSGNYILFLPLCGPKHTKHMVPFINAAAKKYRVVVKLHPQDCREIFEVPGVRYVIGDSKLSIKQIQHAKCVIVSTSTAGIQSMILGTPTISIGSIEDKWSRNYENAGIDLKEKEDINDAIERVIKEQPTDTNKLFLNETITGDCSTGRVLNCLRSLAES